MATAQSISATSALQPIKQNEPVNVSMSEWQMMREQAGMLVKTGFLPQAIKTPEQALAIILTGRELGIGTMAALNNINVIQGKPTVSPQLMLALINRTGEIEQFSLQSSDQGATCTIKRRGFDAYTATFGPKEAASMGLATKDNYKKQPGTMYKWRAVADAARSTFADAVLGLYIPEEMGAHVDTETGEVIEAKADLVEPVRRLESPRQTVESLSERITKVEGGYDCDDGEEVHAIRKDSEGIFCSCGSRGPDAQCVHRLALKLWTARQAAAAPAPEPEPEVEDGEGEVVDPQEPLPSQKAALPKAQFIALCELTRELEATGITEDQWREKMERISGYRSRRTITEEHLARVIFAFNKDLEAASRKGRKK